MPGPTSCKCSSAAHAVERPAGITAGTGAREFANWETRWRRCMRVVVCKAIRAHFPANSLPRCLAGNLARQNFPATPHRNRPALICKYLSKKTLLAMNNIPLGARIKFLPCVFPGGRETGRVASTRCQGFQSVDEVERLARGQLVGADLAQQGLGGGFTWGGLGAPAGGAEEPQRVGESDHCAPLLALFEDGEHLLRAGRYGLRQTGELGDMDAVGAVGGAGADLVQKDDIALPFLDPHRVAGERGKLGGERGQLVVMRREEGAAAGDLVQILESGPGD